jgi:DNA primase
MNVRIGEEARERVRDATDIVQLIGERVQLRRAGRSYKGLCPFHTEKTPSFTVTPDRQIWHCFGCSRGGDVYAFVMEADKVTFPEALRMLADRAGIELPKQERSAGDEAFDKLYQANALARDFFRASLQSGGAGSAGSAETGGSTGGAATAAAKARAYLAGRGFEEPWLTRFEVGWAPEGWDGLLTALSKLLPAEVLEQAGLIVRRGDGSGHYDRFRNRVIFPVATASGKIAGFGARAIAEGDEPKYLNSPETPVFRKGRLLYGLPIARPGIRERGEAIVSEGYLDVIRLHANGFTNAVSTCGTALTPDQARLLARLQVNVLLLYDGDDAGVRAADRGLDPLLEAGVSVRVLLLPSGEDPDSFLRKEGAGALTERLTSALDVPSFIAESKLAGAVGGAAGGGSTGSAGGAGANPSLELRVRRLVGLLGRIEDPIRRRLLLRRGADVFGLEESVLLEAVQGGGRGRRVRKPPDAGKAAAQGTGGSGQPGVVSPGAGASPQASEGAPAPTDPVERELAGRVLTEEGAFTEVVVQGGVICFQSKALRDLLAPWLMEGRPPREDEIRELLAQSPLARSLLAELPPEPGRTVEASRREARELIQRLEERRLKASIQALDQAIREAERSRDEGSLGRLIAERRDLASKLHTRSNHPAIH